MSQHFIPWAKPSLIGNEKRYVLDALESTWISGGPYVDRLEKQIAEKMNVSEVLAVSSGTAALELSLRSLNINTDDEVILPGFTFVAAANIVLGVGAKPIYADVDPDTWLIDPIFVERVVTPKTKAIIPVHLYGNVSNMKAINEISRKYDIVVIEDAAEAIFSKYRGKPAGAIGAIGTYSMHATKTVTTGEGGLVVTDDIALAKKMRRIRSHGMDPKQRYWHDTTGNNFRLTNLQAALGCAQIEMVDEIIKDRLRIHEHYKLRLKEIKGIRLQKFCENVEPVLWAMAVQLVDKKNDLNNVRNRRDRIMEALAKNNIETRPGFFALSMMPHFKCPPLANSLHCSASIISLPTFPRITSAEIDLICDCLIHHIEAI